MKLERLDLNTEKFRSLNIVQKLSIKGGKETGADRALIGAQKGPYHDNGDGTGYYPSRKVYKVWTSDDINADSECYYGTHEEYGPWE